MPNNREVGGRNGYFDDGKRGGLFIRGGWDTYLGRGRNDNLYEIGGRNGNFCEMGGINCHLREVVGRNCYSLRSGRKKWPEKIEKK